MRLGCFRNMALLLGAALCFNPLVLLIEAKERDLLLEFTHPDLLEEEWLDVGGKRLRFTRFSYLVSEVCFLDEGGQWIACNDSYGYLSPFEGRTRMEVSGVELDAICGIRFSIGLDLETNHGDPNLYSAEHPLNPNLNQMHWGWAGGYIFAALEGYFEVDGAKSGFSFHIANDAFRMDVDVPLREGLELRGGLRLEVPILDVLDFEFSTYDAFSHSREGDEIAAQVKSNLEEAFENAKVSSISEVSTEVGSADHIVEQVAAMMLDIENLPKVTLPSDNPMTAAGIELGRTLFFDTRLSKDESLSCASCHDPEIAFSDRIGISPGVDGALGKRNAMPLFNLAWKKEFFWDGRVEGLRNQVLHPMVDLNEMAAELPEIRERLSEDEEYIASFKAVFKSYSITSELIGFALEQYLFSLTSSDSRFDRASLGEVEFTDQEKRGLELFVTEYDPRRQLYGADCFHCHGNNLFTNHQYMNNGLDAEFTDLGRFLVTGDESDKGKFVVSVTRSTVPFSLTEGLFLKASYVS